MKESDKKFVLTIKTDKDCTFFLDDKLEMQLMEGVLFEFHLSQGKHMLKFVDMENPDENLKTEFKMPAKDMEYEVRFQGKVKKIKKVGGKGKKILKALLWIVFAMAIVAAAVLLWDVWQRQKPASVEEMASGDLKITVKGVSFIMKPVEGGTFQMGYASGYEYSGERLVHTVIVSDFYMGETEVTQALWERLMEYNPSFPKDKEKPVHELSWNDCQEFIKKLNQETGLNFRLPTEAEWEYAARGGIHQCNYRYSGGDNLSEVAWHEAYSSINRVKKKRANAVGLFDMSGNVGEWCEDWYDREYYGISPLRDPQGPANGTHRIFRGGSVNSATEHCQVFRRLFSEPYYCLHECGLRLVLTGWSSPLIGEGNETNSDSFVQ